MGETEVITPIFFSFKGVYPVSMVEKKGAETFHIKLLVTHSPISLSLFPDTLSFTQHEMRKGSMETSIYVGEPTTQAQAMNWN